MAIKQYINNIHEVSTYFNRGQIIESQVRKDKDIIYGAQSTKKQLGLFGRMTNDYDIFSKKYKEHSVKLERTLDKSSKGNFYYTKSAMHPGTMKVMHIGADRKPKTQDDIPIADFTKPTRKIKTVLINGIRYSALSESERDKKKALADKQYAFRHEKDREDLFRIQTYGKARRY